MYNEIALLQKYKVCGDTKAFESLNHSNVKLVQQNEIAWDSVGGSRVGEVQSLWWVSTPLPGNLLIIAGAFLLFLGIFLPAVTV